MNIDQSLSWTTDPKAETETLSKDRGAGEWCDAGASPSIYMPHPHTFDFSNRPPLLTLIDQGNETPDGRSYRLWALDETGDVVGRLCVDVADGVATVGVVRVAPTARRQGVATGLLRYVRRLEPDAEWTWEFLTEDGEALKGSGPLGEGVQIFNPDKRATP